jgi:hypothetical protein
VAASAGLLFSLPVQLASSGGNSVSSVLSLLAATASCFLFGVTYRCVGCTGTGTGAVSSTCLHLTRNPIIGKVWGKSILAVSSTQNSVEAVGLALSLNLCHPTPCHSLVDTKDRMVSCFRTSNCQLRHY